MALVRQPRVPWFVGALTAVRAVISEVERSRRGYVNRWMMEAEYMVENISRELGRL
ncbi:uncharacterized protein G2W53_000856 [Senna tora]|uniref:Uncharacterized protein n=1 Tax=Senna tora TaxID=362788 RepID=A0A834XHB6_9FABA|nr:uncharacterized protein G2W53_000856 [Senna tora]